MFGRMERALFDRIERLREFLDARQPGDELDAVAVEQHEQELVSQFRLEARAERVACEHLSNRPIGLRGRVGLRSILEWVVSKAGQIEIERGVHRTSPARRSRYHTCRN